MSQGTFVITNFWWKVQEFWARTKFFGEHKNLSLYYFLPNYGVSRMFYSFWFLPKGTKYPDMRQVWKALHQGSPNKAYFVYFVFTDHTPFRFDLTSCKWNVTILDLYTCMALKAVTWSVLYCVNTCNDTVLQFLRFHPKHPQLSHLKVERSAKEHPLPILTSLVRRGQGTSGVPTHILLLMKRAH